MERIVIETESNDVSLNRSYISVDGDEAMVNRHKTIPEVAEIEAMNLLRELLVNSRIITIRCDDNLAEDFNMLKIKIKTNTRKVKVHLENINKLQKVLTFIHTLITGYRTVSGFSNADFLLGNNLCVSNCESGLCILPCE